MWKLLELEQLGVNRINAKCLTWRLDDNIYLLTFGDSSGPKSSGKNALTILCVWKIAIGIITKIHAIPLQKSATVGTQIRTLRSLQFIPNFSFFWIQVYFGASKRNRDITWKKQWLFVVSDIRRYNNKFQGNGVQWMLDGTKNGLQRIQFMMKPKFVKRKEKQIFGCWRTCAK